MSRRGTLRSDLRCGQVLIMFACYTALFGFGAESAPTVSETNVMQNSSGFGYLLLANPGSEGIIPEEVTSPNPETANPITLPRRDFKDSMIPKTGGRTKRYSHEGSKWPKKNLTYRITKYTSQLDRADVDQTIAEAFAMWSDHTDLTFSPKRGEVDIKISFEHGEHGDGSPFDESPDADLAHAFAPENGGAVHLNDDINWTTNLRHDDSYNLLATAVYGIGSSLGLDTNNVTSSAMYFGVSTFDDTLKLASDDIDGIQALYGPKTVVGNVRKFCANPRVDTIFSSAEGHRYVFKGQNYWRITDDGFATGYPKHIVTTWIGLPCCIEHAYTNKLGETYFYKGSQYWKFVGQRMEPGYPKDNYELATITRIIQWNSYIKAQRRDQSLSMRYYCYLDSIKSTIPVYQNDLK